jgi:uncharacterized protein YdhG (YjbR/CyaY superfamily)
MTSQATTPQQYIDQLPPDRQAAFKQLYTIINKTIDPKFDEQMSYGMIGWVVPHVLYPAGYHVDPKLPVPFINLANQKNYIALYHLGLYADRDLLCWFQTEYAKTGFTLDMGKSCIRFKKIDQIPYTLIGQLVAKQSFDDYLHLYTKTIGR